MSTTTRPKHSPPDTTEGLYVSSSYIEIDSDEREAPPERYRPIPQTYSNLGAHAVVLEDFPSLDHVTLVERELGHELITAPITEIGAASKSEKKRSDDNFTTGENFAVVCDGVGSSKHGGRASQLVVGYLAKELPAVNKLTSRKKAAEHIKETLKKAHELTCKKQKETGLSMASTATTLNYIVDNGKTYALIGNVGDSPAYRVRNGKLREVTHWHRNKMPKPAKRPALGKEMDITPEVYKLRVKPGDTIILTSNGVRKHDQSQKRSNEIIAKNLTPSETAKKLANIKNRRTHDDSTAIVSQVIDIPSRQANLLSDNNRFAA